MANEREVASFLDTFKTKLNYWGVLFVDERSKNLQALLDLEITRVQRRKIVESLVVSDYCEGPVDDEKYEERKLWVFGKYVKGQDIYIKITLGIENSNVICISFHIAEHPLNYPYKKN